MSVFMRLTDAQDLTHPDMANPLDLNRIIWFSARGDKAGEKMPVAVKHPAFDLMTAGLVEEENDFDGERSENAESLEECASVNRKLSAAK